MFPKLIKFSQKKNHRERLSQTNTHNIWAPQDYHRPTHTTYGHRHMGGRTFECWDRDIMVPPFRWGTFGSHASCFEINSHIAEV